MVGFPVEEVLTIVYGSHSVGEKRQFIVTIQTIHARLGGKNWVIEGDFNLITSLAEKKGGRRRREDEGGSFGDTIEDLNLVDILSRKAWFT